MVDIIKISLFFFIKHKQKSKTNKHFVTGSFREPEFFSKCLYLEASYCFIFYFDFALLICLYAVLICLDTLFFLFCVGFSFFSKKQTPWDKEKKLEKNEYFEHLSWIIEEHEIILSFICLLRAEQRRVLCSHISDQPQTVHWCCRLYVTCSRKSHTISVHRFVPYLGTLVFYVC